MLEVNGLKALLVKAGPQHEYAHRKPIVSAHTADAHLVYQRREEFEIRLSSTAGPIDFDATIELFMADQEGLRWGSSHSAARLCKASGWSRLHISRKDLSGRYADGLKFPYVPKHCRFREVGFARLVVTRDDDSDAGVARPRHSAFATFTFHFIDKRWVDNESGAEPYSEQDSSSDEDFHLPTSPNEGIPVTSTLRPKSLVRPNTHYVSAPITPKTSKRKRSESQATRRRVSPLSKRRHGTVSSSSSDVEIVEGPSQRPAVARNQSNRKSHRQISDTTSDASTSTRLHDLTREVERAEKKQAELLNQLIKKQEARLKQIKAANAQLLKALASA